MAQKNSIKHLLVIRLSAMGDVAMTVPILRTVIKNHPDLQITILSKPFFKPLFDDIPNLKFIGADTKYKHKGIVGLKRLSKELTKRGIDGVADLHNVLRSNVLKTFFKMNGLRVVQIDKGRKEKKALTKGKLFSPLKTTHERYKEVFDKLGFNTSCEESAFSPRKKLGDSASAIVGSDDKKWIGIAPFAAFPGKMYPLDLMKEVIDRLNGTESYKLLLFGGGEKETTFLKELAELYKNVVNVAGRLSFEEELALISNLDLMIAMDSGNAHLAALYSVKTITLWGVTHPYAGFYPYEQDIDNALLSDRSKYPKIPTSVYGKKLPKGYENVMRTILPVQVVEKVTSLV